MLLMLTSAGAMMPLGIHIRTAESQGPSINDVTKSQKISEAIFLCFNSSKRPTKKNPRFMSQGSKIGQIKVILEAHFCNNLWLSNIIKWLYF